MTFKKSLKTTFIEYLLQKQADSSLSKNQAPISKLPMMSQLSHVNRDSSLRNA